MISVYELAKKLHVFPHSLYRAFIYHKLRKTTAKKLFKLTQIPIEAWLSPERFFNPYIPFRYQGPYPPDLSHLSGEPRNWALMILANFPERPPTLEEWRKFRREVLHPKKNIKSNNNRGQSHGTTQTD